MSSIAEATIPVVQEPEAANKRGRKTFAETGREKRSEKIMIYVTPTTFSDIKNLSHMKGTTMADFITSLVEDYASSKQEQLKAFLELQQSL